MCHLVRSTDPLKGYAADRTHASWLLLPLHRAQNAARECRDIDRALTARWRCGAGDGVSVRACHRLRLMEL